jgi:hypothetical protein
LGVVNPVAAVDDRHFDVAGRLDFGASTGAWKLKERALRMKISKNRSQNT